MSEPNAASQLLLDTATEVARRHGFPQPAVRRIPVNDVPCEAVAIRFSDATWLYLIAHAWFPQLPPFVVVQWGNGTGPTGPVPVAWDSAGGLVDKLDAALAQLVAPGGTPKPRLGFDPRMPVAPADADPGLSGLRLVLSPANPVPSGASAAAQRIDPAVVEALSAQTVTIVGLGSVGSYLAEQLARTGVGNFVLIDEDVVGPPNLSRTIFTLRDLGWSKAEATRRRIGEIAPFTRVQAVASSLEAFGGARFKEAVERSDLLIAATDSPAAQQLVNACAYASEVMAAFIGLYQGAKGGEVSVSVPGLTPCFRCQSGTRRAYVAESSDVQRSVNYGTGRLEGEIALGCDIQHVSSAALRMIVGLLTAGAGIQADIAQFAKQALVRKLYFLTMGMEAEYWFYPQVFDGVGGQYGFQAVWISADRQPDCPICGEADHRLEDPYAAVRTIPDSSRLRAHLEDAATDA